SATLMARLKREGFRLVLLSAGVWETAEPAREFLGMDDVLATRVEVRNGIYTDRLLTTLHTRAGKGEAIDAYLRKRGRERPFLAFGDSTGDIPMLERARFPVALNPNEELRQEAGLRGWTSVRSGQAVEFVDGLLDEPPARGRFAGFLRRLKALFKGLIAAGN
ncbi:MAG: HAD-IB family phosphatase, partial [Elusimicrobia bacterium]|nr:HAD-IB family phosphatase [Elusimicrobiota bacterium]